MLVVSNFAGEIFSNIFPAHRNLATVMLPIAAGFGVATVPAPYSIHVIFVCRIGA